MRAREEKRGEEKRRDTGLYTVANHACPIEIDVAFFLYDI